MPILFPFPPPPRLSLCYRSPLPKKFPPPPLPPQQPMICPYALFFIALVSYILLFFSSPTSLVSFFFFPSPPLPFPTNFLPSPPSPPTDLNQPDLFHRTCLATYLISLIPSAPPPPQNPPSPLFFSRASTRSGLDPVILFAVPFSFLRLNRPHTHPPPPFPPSSPLVRAPQHTSLSIPFSVGGIVPPPPPPPVLSENGGQRESEVSIPHALTFPHPLTHTHTSQTTQRAASHSQTGKPRMPPLSVV